MNTPTFKEQFDKITTAYLENKLEPEHACACFIGNLLNGTNDWFNMGRCSTLEPNGTISISADDSISNEHDPVYGFYTMKEIFAMEDNFLHITRKARNILRVDEEYLFKAMDSTLDMLRKIHESKGEIIEDFEFKKRQLA